MEFTNTISDSSLNKLPSLVIWKLNKPERQHAVNWTSPQIFQNFVEAKPLDVAMGDHVKWIITKTSGKLKRDQPFPILHHFETDADGEDVGPETELDEGDTRERFIMGMFSHIHGFHGRYALIAITALDLGLDTSFYPLYWIDSNRIDIPMNMVSRAYHSRLRYPFFTLHSA